MTATRIKLTQAGESLTMLVQSCAKATQGTYPGWEFVGQDGPREVMVEIPEGATARQLTRLALTDKSVVGKVLTISRDPNKNQPDKPFWGLSVVGQGNSAPPAQSSAGGPSTGQESTLYHEPESDGAMLAMRGIPSPADGVPDKLVASFGLYDRCMAHALKVALAARDKSGFDVDPAQVAACLYIQANKHA